MPAVLWNWLCTPAAVCHCLHISECHRSPHNTKSPQLRIVQGRGDAVPDLVGSPLGQMAAPAQLTSMTLQAAHPNARSGVGLHTGKTLPGSALCHQQSGPQPGADGLLQVKLLMLMPAGCPGHQALSSLSSLKLSWALHRARQHLCFLVSNPVGCEHAAASAGAGSRPDAPKEHVAARAGAAAAAAASRQHAGRLPAGAQLPHWDAGG